MKQQSPDRRRLMLLAGGIAALHALFIYRTRFEFARSIYFSLFDDAMISMTYARNFARGAGLVWNVGEGPIEGYSNFLWTLWMALVHGMGFGDQLAPLVVAVSSSSALLVCLFLVARLSRLLGANDRVALIAAVLTGSAYALTYWSLRGMEVGVLAALYLGAIILYLQERSKPTKIGLPALFLLIAAVVLVRADGLVLVAGLVMAWVLEPDRLESRAMRAVGIVVAAGVIAFAAHTSFRWWYYGDLLPNTYYLKMTGVPTGTRVARGVEYLLFESTLCLSPLLLHFSLPRERVAAVVRTRLCLYTVVAAQLGYSAYAGGDAWEWMMQANRFVSSAWPLTACIVAPLVWEAAHTDSVKTMFRCMVPVVFPPIAMHAARRLSANDWMEFQSAVGPLVVTVLVVTTLMLVYLRPRIDRGKTDRPTQPRYVWAVASLVVILAVTEGPSWLIWTFNRGYDVDTDAMRSEIGLVLRKSTSRDARVGLQAAGAVPYFSERRAVDFLGKSDRVIARLETNPRIFWPGHNKVDGEYSIGRLRPEVVWQPVLDEARLAELGYERISMRVGDHIEPVYVLQSAVARQLVDVKQW